MPDKSKKNPQRKSHWTKSDLEGFYYKLQDEICQVLGKALGWYPWYKDDQKNFPGATEADGVCVGEHVAESMADEVAGEIKRLRFQVREAHAELRACARDYDMMNCMIVQHNKLIGKIVSSRDFKWKLSLELIPFAAWHEFTSGPSNVAETLRLISVHIPNDKLDVDKAREWLRSSKPGDINERLRADGTPV